MSTRILSRLFLVAIISLYGSGLALAQGVGQKHNEWYLKGVDLYEKNLYADAEAAFRKASRETDPADMLTRSEIASYRAMCAIALRLPNLESYVDELTGNFPENKNINFIRFETGNYFFHEKDYKKALAWYEQVDSRALRYYQHVECVFKKGYAYFERRQYTKASRCFIEVKDVPNSPYSAPATYYYGHTEYQKKNYVSAQLAFEKVLQDDRFAAQAPFYLIQIYYLQQEYEEAAATGVRLLPSVAPPQNREIARIVAESFFQLKDYEQARTYYALYSGNQAELSRADKYFLALLEYHAQSYDKAAALFEEVSQKPADSLAQNAAYHLGSARLQLEQKSKALTAFEMAARNNYLPNVAKDALLQYAKLSLELNGNSQPMEKYFEKYPNRSADPEIIRYRAALHLSKQQYKKALDELLALPQPTDKEKADIQRLNFLVGQQLYELHSSNYYQEAIRYFDAALNMGRYNARLEASARYHKAEACFMLHNFKEAQPLYENFINSSGAFASGNDYLAAHYNLGYCFFKMKDYDKALSWFRKFITLAGDTFRQQVADAYNRTGDCHYMQGKYWPATDNYGKAADMKAANPDYALYYKAISYGLLNRADRKIETLNELVAAYPQSTYVPQALLERGRTHLQANRYSDAEASFMQLVNNYPASALLPQAYIELGLIRSNTGRLNEAIDYYKDAQRKSTPNSNDEKSALIGLQNAYADLGTPHTYFEYLESIGKETNRNEKEQALYNAAEKSANSGHCEKAIQEFNRFIEEYQGSTLLPQAHYYLANCYYQNSNFALAATHYQYTAQQAKDIAYKELSLLKSSQANTQLENYEAALENLRALVALSDNQNHLLTAYMNMAQLQAHQLHNHREAANSAQSALSFEGINNRQAREMKLIKANSWNTLGQTDAAMEVYQEITAEQQKDLENAEATYHLIAHTFAQGDFNEGENKVVAFSKTEPSRYWVARCYILLAGEYAKRGNEVQALATYESILNGYTNPADGIRETVQQQIDLLKNKDTQ